MYYKTNVKYTGRQQTKLGEQSIVYIDNSWKSVYTQNQGTIDAIEQKDILGEKQDYYIIKMPGEVKVMVPISKAEDVGVRNIINKEEAGKVLEILEANETEMSNNWNKRYKDNMDKMKSGSIYEVADVVRNLSYKQKEKGLSTGEKKMLNNAKQILISELVLAEHASENEVVDLVENKINLSFEEHRNLGEVAFKDMEKKDVVNELTSIKESVKELNKQISDYVQENIKQKNKGMNVPNIACNP